MYTVKDEHGEGRSQLVEFSPTEQMFNTPTTKEAEEYISGRCGYIKFA
ncbi:hypothetical protein [Fischerella sp. JS2]|nr:hypothetical protein [Fischerella sp. JS2]